MKRHFLAAVFLSLAALPLRAQIPDARLMPAGALRWAFTPSWKSWDRVLDVNGNERLLTSLASSDSAGADLFSVLAPADAAIRGIPGVNPAYRLNLGVLKTALDADWRRFPLDFAVGLGSRITLTAGIPIVVTRMNAVLTLDSTTGNAGLNDPAAVTAVLGQLNTAATQLSARIAAGTATCGQPAAVLSRTQALVANLSAMAGVGAATTPAAAPTLTSTAGVLITQALTGLYADLGLCGTPVGSVLPMPLPGKRMSATDIQNILTAPGLGYETDPFVYTKYTGLGDADVGLRIGVLQATHARFVLFGGARLPIGTRDTPQNLIDIAPADHQLDVTGGFEVALEPGSALGLSVAGSYTRQFADKLERRVAPVDQIINNGPILLVNRDLGDELSFSVFPGIRLNDAFRVYAGGTYYRKGADRYTGAPNADSLGVRTAVQATSFTGGIQYRSMGIPARLPIEAGLTYSAVYTGKGGFVPKATTLTMYLRFYYRLWGGKASAVPG